MRRVLLIAACLVLGGCAAPATPGSSGLPQCTSLPDEALETIAVVQDGGPYPYPDNDDKRFGNYEGNLPQERSGYYREYTVPTPGLGHRGARRIVTGGGADGVVDEWFYTADHYESFCQIRAEEVPNA